LFNNAARAVKQNSFGLSLSCFRESEPNKKLNLLIKSTFSIRDLESLSGVKAHTIRIWEKRYALLQPDRTETNIRTYDVDALRKLLNVNFLKENGYKISKVAEYSAQEIEQIVSRLAGALNQESYPINQLKLAMANFDEPLFHKIFDGCVEEKGLDRTIEDLVIPFLKEIGLLWHSNAIELSHEHFIGNLITMKIIKATDDLPVNHSCDERVFVLFLPENEMHELGLMYVNYILKRNGFKTIYIGASITIDGLQNLKALSTESVFLTYLTVEPKPSEVPAFLQEFNNKIQSDTQHELWLLGNIARELDTEHLMPGQRIFNDLEEIKSLAPALTV
jgi:DNA-binding transcriptional MerR regulator